MNELTILKSVFLLTIVMDPIGNVATFLVLLRKHDQRRQRRIILREMLIALAAMLLVLWFGKEMLQVVGLDQSSLQITGGLLLFLIAIRMVFPGIGMDPSGGDHELDDPLIVPLAMPLVVGPSVITTLMLMAAQAPERLGQWTIAVLIAWAVCAVILYFSGLLNRLFGAKGLEALQRLMGMLLSAMAIQMFIRGIHTAFPGLAAGVN